MKIKPRALVHPLKAWNLRRLKAEAVKKVDLAYQEMRDIHPGAEYYFIAHGHLDPLATFSAQMVRRRDMGTLDRVSLHGVIEAADQVLGVVSETDRDAVIEYHLERADDFRQHEGDGLETDHMFLT